MIDIFKKTHNPLEKIQNYNFSQNIINKLMKHIIIINHF